MLSCFVCLRHLAYCFLCVCVIKTLPLCMLTHFKPKCNADLLFLRPLYTSTAPGNGVQTESAESQLITPCLTSSACVSSSVFLIVYQSFYFFSQCIFFFSQYIYGSLNIYSIILQYFLFLFQPARCCCLYQHVC